MIACSTREILSDLRWIGIAVRNGLLHSLDRQIEILGEFFDRARLFLGHVLAVQSPGTNPPSFDRELLVRRQRVALKKLVLRGNTAICDPH